MDRMRVGPYKKLRSGEIKSEYFPYGTINWLVNKGFIVKPP